METYKNTKRSFEERASDLISRMTLEEKISQLGNISAAIPRLGIPGYNYWSEASHGVYSPFKMKEMDVTSFPVCLALSQTWNRETVKKVAKAISDECRAYHNKDGDELHFYNPTINLARDPRNGRSDENFGEDPVLAGELAVSYVEGFQDREGKYVKAIATPKHYALNSSENNRHKGSSNADEATIREYYAKVFEKAVREGKAESIMTSYNRINGVPASANDFLLTTLLREEWGFDGFVVSDCGAVGDTYNSPMFSMGAPGVNGHFYVKSAEQASAATLRAGTDMTCGTEHKYFLLNAVNQGLISESVIDRALLRIYTSRFRLGLFEPEEQKPYKDRTADLICSKDMERLAVEAANESIVLLKNDRQLLPLKLDGVKKVLVVGPNAIYRELGGYSAGAVNPAIDTVKNVMALEGIRNAVKDTEIEVAYEKGWATNKESAPSGLQVPPGADLNAVLGDLLGPDVDLQQVMRIMTMPHKFMPDDPQAGMSEEELLASALRAAQDADYVIVIAGTDATTASEEFDRTTLELPYGQNEKIKKLLEANPNTIVVLSTLGAVTGDFMDYAHTLVNAHYAGQEQGTAIANVLFGKVNPSAKLTATWYKSLNDLPAVNDYGLCWQDTLDGKARTYMYFKGDVLFPFGYGLSYTSFQYSNLKLSSKKLDANDVLSVSVDVTNTGAYDGDEVVELYVSKVIPEDGYDKKPVRQLKAFDKVHLAAGETKTVTMELPVHELSFWSNFFHKMIVEEGSYHIEVGACSADLPLHETIEVTGIWNSSIASVYAVADRYILTAGESTKVKLAVTLQDAKHLQSDEYTVSFASVDDEVVNADPDGVVTAVKAGTTEVVITASYKGRQVSSRIPFTVKE